MKVRERFHDNSFLVKTEGLGRLGKERSGDVTLLAREEKGVLFMQRGNNGNRKQRGLFRSKRSFDFKLKTKREGRGGISRGGHKKEGRVCRPRTREKSGTNMGERGGGTGKKGRQTRIHVQLLHR